MGGTADGGEGVNLRYLLTGVVRRYLPPPVLFGIMRLRGDGNGAEGEPDRNADSLISSMHAQGIEITGRHLLELGSGRYARQALYLLAHGARHVTLVDLYATPLSDLKHRALLHADCLRLGLDPAQVLAHITICTGDFLQLPLPNPSERPDLIFSVAVMEHVRDPEAILQCCYTWLPLGGQTFHIIDLRDHNMQFRYPFEMLTYSDEFWHQWLDQPGGFHLNRWRSLDYAEAIKRAGFTQICCETMMADREGLCAVEQRLASHFRRYGADQLAIQGIALTGLKSNTDTPAGQGS